MLEEYNKINTPQELLSFMMKYIHYGFIDKNNKVYDNPENNEWSLNWFNGAIVQDKDELLNSTYGTCYDQVELERDWFNSHGYEFKTIFLIFNMDRENNLPTHSALIYKNNEKYYYFEHAWMDTCGIIEFNSYMDVVKYIKNNHYQCSLEYSDILGLTKDDLSVYEFDKPKKDSSIPEYFDNIFENGTKIDI